MTFLHGSCQSNCRVLSLFLDAALMLMLHASDVRYGEGLPSLLNSCAAPVVLVAQALGHAVLHVHVSHSITPQNSKQPLVLTLKLNVPLAILFLPVHATCR